MAYICHMGELQVQYVYPFDIVASHCYLYSLAKGTVKSSDNNTTHMCKESFVLGYTHSITGKNAVWRLQSTGEWWNEKVKLILVL